MPRVTSFVSGQNELSAHVAVSPGPRATASVGASLHSRVFPFPFLCLSVLLLGVVSAAGAVSLQTQTHKADPRISAETAKKYLGRYELESGIIPVSTLDITFEGDELWIKPSDLKKRRMIRSGTSESTNVFLDEVSGTPYRFNQDEEGKVISLTFQYEDAEFTAQRVVLPPPSLKGNTTFRLRGHERASVVVLSGSFNNWNQSQYIFGREGDVWICRIDLEPGKHAYKFIIDGNWILDPANPNSEDDDYGVKNSVINVAKTP